ncbi:MAG TPA: hypothetical protein ENF21_09660 [Bacteroidetes bacterium]|nr:hypothetical protein [Bacteroidota bacterium]
MKNILFPLLPFMALCVVILFSCKKNDPFHDSFEPNDSRHAAGNLALGNPVEAGIGEDDHDWYRVTVDNDDIIDITEIALTDVSANLDAACNLYDADGNHFYGAHADQGMDFAINLASRGGAYYIEIYSYSGRNKGYYTLTVSDTDSNDNYEPDESFGNARQIGSFPSGELTGNIIFEASGDEPEGDWEFFKVTVGAEKKISFHVAPDEEDMILQYELFSSDQLALQDDPVIGQEGEALSGYYNNYETEETWFFVKLGGKPSNRLNGDYTIAFTESGVDPGK